MEAPHRSDYVRDSKLSTKLTTAETHHIYYASGPHKRRRRERRVETWRWERKLGGGTFGKVWLETCVAGDSLGELRAVKELKKEFDGLIVDYTRELEAVAKFSHRNYVDCFVKSFGWYETETTIRIAMEYMSNGDLKKHMNRRFEDSEARKIAWQLAEALDFVHSNGFVHRDLKPANILVEQPGPDWWVKVGDFGICKRAEQGSTAFRTLIGTEGYIAPEVLGLVLPDDHSAEDNGSFFYTSAVDIWALGEIVFRLRTQLPAFPKPGDLSWYALKDRMLWVKPLRNQDASEDCCDFVTRAMIIDPRHRMTAAEASVHAWVRPSPSSARSSPSPSIRPSNDTSAFSNSQHEAYIPVAVNSVREPSMALFHPPPPSREAQSLEQNFPDEGSPITSSHDTQDDSNPDPATSTLDGNIDEDATANWSTVPQVQPVTFATYPVAQSHANDSTSTRTSQGNPQDVSNPDPATSTTAKNIDEDATADWSTLPRVQPVPFFTYPTAESHADDSTLTRTSQGNPMRIILPEDETNVSQVGSSEARLNVTSAENPREYGYDYSNPVAEQEKANILTPVKSGVKLTQGGSIPLSTSAQPIGPAPQSWTAENTPRPGKKHKAAGSSSWFPKISRWSETTASNITKAFRASSKKESKYDEYAPSRPGSSLASYNDDADYQHNPYEEDKLHTGFSEQNLGDHATQPSQDAAVTHRPPQIGQYLPGTSIKDILLASTHVDTRGGYEVISPG